MHQINLYISNCNPFDKAGAYGIQDWIGKIGIKNIEGSYSNVVGLPTAEVYQQLKLFVENVNIMKLHFTLDKLELQTNPRLDSTNVQNANTDGVNTKLSDH